MKKLFIILFLCLVQLTLLGADRSNQWPKVRKEFLKTHSVCALCGTQKSLQVHHIKPFHLNPKLELEPSNLITLCTSKYWGFNCHFVVGHGSNFKYENIQVVEDVAILEIMEHQIGILI